MALTVVPLELVIDDADGSVTIRTRSRQQDDDRPLTKRIPDFLKGHPHSTAAAVAEALGSSSDVVSSTLSELKKRGEVNNAVNGHTTREWIALAYVIAQLDADGRAVGYLDALAAKEFGPDLTHRLTSDVTLARRFRDRESAHMQLASFMSARGTPPLAILALPTEG